MLKRVTTDEGVELQYQVAGDGGPAVFIHGAFIADAFKLLLHEPSLVTRYSLLAYHRRGYGNSSGTGEPVSIARHAGDCRDLLHSLGFVQAHVVGHSYGGAVALQFALDFPEMVKSLAILEPALIVGENGPAYRKSLEDAMERYRKVGAEAVVHEFLGARWPEYHTHLDRLLPGAFAQAVRDARTTLEYDLPGLLEWRFGEAEASRIHQPALCVLGGRSQALSPRFGEVQRLLLSWLSNSEECALPSATHLMAIEQPRETAEALGTFWARCG